MIEIKNRKPFDIEIIDGKIIIYTPEFDADNNIVWDINELTLKRVKEISKMITDVIIKKENSSENNDIIIPTVNIKVVLSLRMLGDKFMQIATVKANEIIAADNLDGMKIMMALQECKDFDNWRVRYNEYFGEFVKVIA